MYSRILIPINSAETIHLLIPKLRALNSHLLDSTITLLYVQTLVYNTAVGLDAVVVTPDVEPEGILILDGACRLFKRMRLSCRKVLRTGDPVEEIYQYAAHKMFDLIVVERREKGLLESLLFTRVSDELVKKASTHVLVLK